MKKENKTPVTEEEKKINKLNSRKFMVWAFWTLLLIVIMIVSLMRDNDEIILKALEYYFTISAIYIGGNCITKGINAYIHKTDSEA